VPFAGQETRDFAGDSLGVVELVLFEDLRIEGVATAKVWVAKLVISACWDSRRRRQSKGSNNTRPFLNCWARDSDHTASRKSMEAYSVEDFVPAFVKTELSCKGVGSACCGSRY